MGKIDSDTDEAGVAPRLSPSASSLLRRLQTDRDGEGFGIPSVYPGSGAFFDHAEAYLRNAAELCRDPKRPDFNVFGAFFFVRHGVELWLKGMITNHAIDAVLESIREEGANFEKAVEVAVTRLNAPKSRHKHVREQLQETFCVLRNGAENGSRHPSCVKMNESYAGVDRAIEFVFENGDLPRCHFGDSWRVAIHGHKLMMLWKQSRPLVEGVHEAVVDHANMNECGHPMPLSEIAAIVELLDHFDPDGDAFRYPAALDGTWNAQLPGVSLSALGALADNLAESVLGYESLMTEAYQLSTLRSPWPGVWAPTSTSVTR